MADTIIDTLQVKVTANAQAATKSLRELSGALQRVRTALTGMKDGATVTDHLSKSLNEMNNALSNISNGNIKRLTKLADALHDYADAVQRIKGIKGGIGNSIKETTKAIRGGESTSKGGSDIISYSTDEVEDFGDAVDDTGKKIKRATGFFGKFIKSISRIMLYRAIRSALKAVGEAFEEGLKNAYHYSQQSESFARLADTLDRIKSITTQMVNQLGAFWGEIKQFILPAVEWIVEQVRKISEWLTELFAALNGQSTYLQAQYTEEKWDDATDAVKKYKHQLLGLDELNNLSKNNDSGKEAKDYSKMFKEVSVSPELQAVGAKWQAIKQKIEEILNNIHLTLLGNIGMIALGAVLTFSGTNIPLGLAMLGKGVYNIMKQYPDWDSLKQDIQDAFREYAGIIAIGTAAMAAVGLLLLFVPGYMPLGIGMILASAVITVANVVINWDQISTGITEAFDKHRDIFNAVAAVMAIVGLLLLPTHFMPLGIGMIVASGIIGVSDVVMHWDKIKEEITRAFQENGAAIFGLAIAIAAIGALLLFTQHYVLGISAIVASGALGVADIVMNWDSLKNAVSDAFTKYGDLLAIGAVGSIAVGILLLFTPLMPLGIGLLVAGGALAAADIAFNWDSILEGLKSAWEGVKAWWNNTVMGAVKKGIGKVEELLNIDFNGDGTIGIITTHTSSTGVTHGGVSGKFASGGVPTQGTLFYAGESGAEFVGNIGNSSAVANTQQMTDAIYKAAYMGMSKALQENGGNGFNGFEPATTDDLFIAMRKKASNYNKMTGNPAFG